MKPTCSSFLGLLCLVSLLGCDRKTGVQKASEEADRHATSSIAKPIRLAAAAAPIAWLGCQVVGDPCESVGLIPPGASAHSWEPKPSDLTNLERADAWLRTGLAFETSWSKRLQTAIPKLPVLDLRGALDLRNQGHRHSADEAMDPHVWTSPRSMKVLAETLAVRLAAQRPDLQERIGQRMPVLRKRLDSLDGEARSLLAPWSGRTILINHPGLGYLARDYGLDQKALESHGREMSPVDLFEAARVARGQGVKVIFVQREASDRVARAVAEEMGVPLIPIEVFATPWDSAFVALVRTVAQNL
jgi:zinc transport system substrate-binding protein